MSIIILTDWATFIEIVATDFELYIILGTKFSDYLPDNLARARAAPPRKIHFKITLPAVNETGKRVNEMILNL